MDSTLKTWNPEANTYSRAFNPELLIDLIVNKLEKSDLEIFFNIVRSMNSSNRIGIKYLKQIKMPRSTKSKSLKRLFDNFVIFPFSDGSIMVNPKLVLLSKYRKQCLGLQHEWNTAIKGYVNKE